MGRRKKRQASMFESQTEWREDGKLYRRCVYCGRWKPITDYPRNGVDEKKRPAYRQDCKTCYNIRRKENRFTKEHSDFVGGMKRRGETDVEYTHQDWKETLMFFRGTCAYCGCTPKKGQILTKDHLTPVKNGGKTIQSNIIPACRSCNCSKGADDFKDWYMRQPFFSQERLNEIFKWRTIMRLAEGYDSDENGEEE